LEVNYANFSANSSLTLANQQYFLFLYTFFDINGNTNAFAVWTAVSFYIQNKYLRHRFKFGAGNIFSGQIDANIHYKYRKFFGKEEINENINIELKNTGIAFLSYSFEGSDWDIKKTKRIFTLDCKNLLLFIFEE
jgi:hypothetical protein